MVLIEQGIKLVVRNYKGVETPIINNFIYFRPKQNVHYSWLNSMVEIQNTRFFHIALTTVLLIFTFFVFRYFAYKYGPRIYSGLLEVFLISGMVCSLIDRVFWNGSLDYILLKGFFIFDLKDVYLSTFQVLFVFFVVKNWNAISKMSEKELFTDFINFIKK